METKTIGAQRDMAEKSGTSGKDDLLFNKIAGAVLSSILLILVIRLVGEAFYHPEPLDKPAYVIAVAETTDSHSEEPKVVDLATLLASADPDKGKRLAKKCAVCHTFDKGGKNGTGPNLWDVIGRPKAALANFNYSPALKAAGGEWSYEELSHFLENPKGFISGTQMSFAGLRKPEDRAHLIAYMRTLSDNPPPLPATAAKAESALEATEAAAAPHEGSMMGDMPSASMPMDGGQGDH